MQEPKPLDRRRFLTVLGTSIAVAACSDDEGDGSPAPLGDVPAGNVQNVAVGALTLVGSEPVVLGRDTGGLYAMTVTCTHQGCDVQPSGTGTSAVLNCPCHGSQFDRNGLVLQGPARSPLVHYAVEVDASGNIIIHGGMQVGADVRTVVA